MLPQVSVSNRRHGKPVQPQPKDLVPEMLEIYLPAHMAL